MSNRRQFVVATAATLGLPAFSAAAAAWPDKPLRIIVPFPPGGTSDVIARLLTKPLGDALKTNVIVENKTGANGAIGAAAVATATDDHTMLLSDMSSLAISPHVTKDLPYKPEQLKGATMLAYSPHLLATHPSVPANNLAEFVAWSKQKPINAASSGIGSVNHLGIVEIAMATGMRWTHVPFRGGAQSIQDVAAGNTQLVLNGMLATLPLVQGGKLKLLGVSKATRMALIGDVPTIAEQGVRGYESGTYQGVAIPAGMPRAAAEKLAETLIAVIRSPDLRARLVGAGAEVLTTTPKETTEFLQREGKRWAAVMQRAGKNLEGNA